MLQRLTDRIVETLRELGPSFAFVGRHVHLEVGGDDFYIDLLFFHVEQLRYYVFELKTGRFQPQYAGKLNYYVAVVDDLMKRKFHNETVGILICGSKKRPHRPLRPGPVNLADGGIRIHLRAAAGRG